MINIKHSSNSPDWYTPKYIVDASREALGGVIHLDPASSLEANKIVKADRIFTAEDNGLSKAWFGNVFLNPPGTCRTNDEFPSCGSMLPTGKRRRSCSCRLVDKFWSKLIGEHLSGNVVTYVNKFIWIGFSVEQLQSLQKFERSPLDFHLCFPKKRIPFVGAGKQPSHANYIAGYGMHRNVFREAFKEIGKCRVIT